ncbi:transcription initiation factor TFIID subunit 8-like [Phalaenopsis equestris]|uniref:transcription initiation factor TFIID subunit 8-like n=1 Tax=Phalaenopsis equestris TaxID=78828 RepID=UPI0009E3F22C|nr:transcription initiation factor TFIID subunit 8-like [Phalaenopsis equestris]XP_020572878.1 transcription initiation factor TFIID subunit 8-like [Phalaenopsis equestris]XP_020572879.1 transcription initiation factor TFIID subunit 8-like [Phalaenopsis equestris]XP_020572880.1 transcription initiation factor TFIID subunit 8-like [Phalaenopsis equestris]XP_020572881.1 transcription initiation factor TFIID subunit 8-like [Phalaenopsis equestris]
MSDGGKQGGADNENNSSKKTKLKGGDEFGRAISRIAVAQICESTGFQSSQRSALEAFVDITIRYICSLGKAARYYADISGRTECNVLDLIQGLEDIVGLAQGFTGGSDDSRCLVGSGIVRDIYQFVSSADEVPFPRAIPRFPVVQPLKNTPSFAQLGKTPASKHVPDWLPAFPELHTYVHTPVWNERTTDRRTDKLEQTKQRRRAETSLLSLQQRIACTGEVGFVPSGNSSDSKGKQVAESNPFLVPPLPYDSKQVSAVAIPKCDVTKKSFSVLETFAPAIEAAKAGAPECRAIERRSLPGKRAPVHFRIGVDKKSILAPLSSGVLGSKSDDWFLRDDQKDDKKRRAEMILKEAMENPQELIQL